MISTAKNFSTGLRKLQPFIVFIAVSNYYFRIVLLIDQHGHMDDAVVQ
jgi:hypothetical protein